MTKKRRKDPFNQKMADYSTFINQMYDAVFANLVAWGIPPATAAAILALLTPFNAAYDVSKNKTTATSVDRQKTKDARKALNDVARPFVQKWIFLNEMMTDADIKTCGLDPKDKVKSPVAVPDTEPDMYLKPSTSHTIKGFYRQPEESPGVRKRGKPAGVKSVRVAVFVGDTPPSEPDDFPKFYSFSTTTGGIPFPAAQAGQKVTIASAWVNEKEEQGDWCEPQTMNVP
jgi:hypothetical protein